MESVIVACITGVVTLVGVILSNSKSRAVISTMLADSLHLLQLVSFTSMAVQGSLAIVLSWRW